MTLFFLISVTPGIVGVLSTGVAFVVADTYG